MQVELNGAPTELPDNASLTDLINQMDLAGKRIAIEVNEEIIPRSQHTSYILTAGDKVEVVHAIGGG